MPRMKASLFKNMAAGVPQSQALAWERGLLAFQGSCSQQRLCQHQGPAAPTPCHPTWAPRGLSQTEDSAPGYLLICAWGC